MRIRVMNDDARKTTEERRPQSRPVLPQVSTCLEAIARGEAIASEVHSGMLEEPSVLEIEKFNFWYGRSRALWDVTVRIPRHRVTALIGPSGCGKSTLIRCVNRLNDL